MEAIRDSTKSVAVAGSTRIFDLSLGYWIFADRRAFVRVDFKVLETLLRFWIDRVTSEPFPVGSATGNPGSDTEKNCIL
jgi:hypothetical protein